MYHMPPFVKSDYFYQSQKYKININLFVKLCVSVFIHKDLKNKQIELFIGLFFKSLWLL